MRDAALPTSSQTRPAATPTPRRWSSAKLRPPLIVFTALCLAVLAREHLLNPPLAEAAHSSPAVIALIEVPASGSAAPQAAPLVSVLANLPGHPLTTPTIPVAAEHLDSSAPDDSLNSCASQTADAFSIKAGLPPEDVLQWLSLVCVFFPQEHVRTAICVISYESVGDEQAVGDLHQEDTPAGTSHGLFQIKWENIYRTTVAGAAPFKQPTKAAAIAFLEIGSNNIQVAGAMVQITGWLPDWAAQKQRCGLRA